MAETHGQGEHDTDGSDGSPEYVRSPARPPSMTDVAQHAGVSQPTVSNVINHPSRVRQSTIDRVETSIRVLGFVPNLSAQTLVRGSNRTIGMVLPGLDHSFAIDTARGAQQEASQHNYQLLLASADRDASLERSHVNFFIGSQVAGIILTPLVSESAGYAPVDTQGIPTVIVNYSRSDGKRCHVITDNVEVGRIAVRHLAERGCQRIAFVMSGDIQPAAKRLEGATEEAATGGAQLALEVINVADHTNQHDGFAAGIELGGRPPHLRADGVIGVTDILAAGVIAGLEASGLHVPEDVLVMGCDSNKFAWGGTVPLTTVDGRSDVRAAMGVRLLLEELSSPPNGHAHRVEVIQPILIPRRSTQR